MSTRFAREAPRGRPAHNRLQLPVEEIARRYTSGEPVSRIARHFSVTEAAILLRLDEANVQLRGQSAPRKHPEIVRVWCEQCQRRVGIVEGQNCRSQWCKA